jgi:hypothetical protein
VVGAAPLPGALVAVSVPATAIAVPSTITVNAPAARHRLLQSDCISRIWR